MKIIRCFLCSFLLMSSTAFANESRHPNKNILLIITNPSAQEMFGYFRAHRQGKGVTLNWGMSFNTQIAYFIIERSYDGEFFDPLAQVSVNGSKRQSWNDASVFPGYIHYRIVCVMNDATEIYSDVETVRIVQRG